MSVVERSIEVDVPVDDFYRVVTDYKSYEQFLSEMHQVSVGERGTDGRREVTYVVEIDAGFARKQIRYTLRHSEQAPHSVRWELISGESMKRNNGSWTLASAGKGRTRATYAIDIGFGLLVPRSVVGFLTERNLPTMLAEFKRRAETLAKQG